MKGINAFCSAGIYLRAHHSAIVDPFNFLRRAFKTGHIIEHLVRAFFIADGISNGFFFISVKIIHTPVTTKGTDKSHFRKNILLPFSWVRKVYRAALLGAGSNILPTDYSRICTPFF
jgi:hypothetical protein